MSNTQLKSVPSTRDEIPRLSVPPDYSNPYRSRIALPGRASAIAKAAVKQKSEDRLDQMLRGVTNKILEYEKLGFPALIQSFEEDVRIIRARQEELKRLAASPPRGNVTITRIVLKDTEANSK